MDHATEVLLVGGRGQPRQVKHTVNRSLIAAVLSEKAYGWGSGSLLKGVSEGESSGNLNGLYLGN